MWAKTLKSTKQPVERKCKYCLMTVDMAYAHLGWDQTVAKSHASADLKRDFQQAVKICKGDKPKTFPEETVEAGFVTGFTVERQFILVSEQEFAKAYNCKPQNVAGITVERFVSEAGVPSNFVIMADDGKNPGARRLRVHSTCDVAAHEKVMVGASQLRQGQCFDVKDFYEQDWRKAGVPRTLFNSAGVVPDGNAVAELVKAHLHKMEQMKVANEVAAAAMPAAAQPPESLPNNQEVKEEDDKSEESEHEHASFAQPILLPSERQQQKGRGKGSGRGGRNGKRSLLAETKPDKKKRKTAASASAMSPSRAGSVRSGGDAASTRTGITKRFNTKLLSPNKSGVAKYVSDLDIPTILSGDLLKQPMYQARRQHDVLAREKPGCADAVILQRHLNLAQLAQDWVAVDS